MSKNVEEARACMCQGDNLRISMRIDLEVLSSFDLVTTTSASGSECECERMSVNSNFGITH